MPAIEAFADGATVFPNAVAPRGVTRPSYASMLTGLYPYRHGVRTNMVTLHEDVETLPEILQNIGYHTAGFVSNIQLLHAMSGIGQGFDVYNDDVESDGRVSYERHAGGTLRRTLDWLKSEPSEPFFLFTNFIDPHGPYLPPSRFSEEFSGGEEVLLERKQIPNYQRLGENLDYTYYVNQYDAEIRYVDQALGVLIDELKQRDLWDNSIIVFTADHGESLGEHGMYFDHFLHLWEETIRVPLIIQIPVGRGMAPAKVDLLSSPMDLPATILEMLGLEIPGAMDGVSLWPTLSGEEYVDRSIFVEGVVSLSQRFPSLFAHREKRYKLIQRNNRVNGEIEELLLFDVLRDPLEQTPLPIDPQNESHRTMIESLERSISAASTYELPFEVVEYRLPGDDQRATPGKRPRTPLGKEQIERLRSLGYIQ